MSVKVQFAADKDLVDPSLCAMSRLSIALHLHWSLVGAKYSSNLSMLNIEAALDLGLSACRS